MALFEKKEAEPKIAGVAECDAALAQLARQRQEIIYKVGQKYVENNTAASAAGTIYAGELQELEAIMQEMEKTEVKKLALQGLRKCEKCGNVLTLDSAFCNKCGEKLTPVQIEPASAATHCPKCGSLLDSGAAFCTSCGNKL